MSESLADLVQHRREESGDVILNRFGNGLTIKTEAFFKPDPMRILPLGGPQGSLMNHMLHFPDSVRGKRVLEPFAGSGGLGFMALACGASHLDLLDINPRAAEFHRESAALSHIDAERFTSITGDIADFVPAQRYDLILANPPFVPTPDGIDGTLTSNGGPEGNRFAAILLERLDLLLDPGGRVLLYLLQLTQGGEPAIGEVLRRTVKGRPVEITPSQKRLVPLQMYCDAYSCLFSESAAAIAAWRSEMMRRHGIDAALGHYIVDIGAENGGPTAVVRRDNFAAKFGNSFAVPDDRLDELAFARVLENYVSGSV